MVYRIALLLVVFVVFAACGDDSPDANSTAPDAAMGTDAGDDAGIDEVTVTKNCDAPFDDTVVQGRYWLDADDLAVSMYAQDLESEQPGLEDRQTHLFLPDGTILATLSCPDGVFRFPGVQADVALLSFEDDGCTSANCPTRFAQRAIEDGSVKVVTFGDSIPHFGPKPWFPAMFAELAEPLVEVENTNVAVPGATSVDWLPESQFFRNRIEAHLDADVWVFSLGGNDLQEFADDAQSAADPTQVLEQLRPVIDEIVENIRSTVRALRAISPDSDIVWVIYPNYGTSTLWKTLVGPELEGLLETALGNILKDVRARVSGESGLHIVDILGAMTAQDAVLDQMLTDPLHLNETGHTFYARELFVTLGGVIIDDNPQGLNRRIGYTE